MNVGAVGTLFFVDGILPRLYDPMRASNLSNTTTDVGYVVSSPLPPEEHPQYGAVYPGSISPPASTFVFQALCFVRASLVSRLLYERQATAGILGKMYISRRGVDFGVCKMCVKRPWLWCNIQCSEAFSLELHVVSGPEIA